MRCCQRPYVRLWLWLRRFREPTVEDVEALTLEKMRDCIRGQMRPENVEISIVGDLTAAEVRSCYRVHWRWCQDRT